MTDDDLFSWSARNTDPDTSHKAAGERKLLRARDRGTALLILAQYPNGLTDFELAAIMQRQQTSAGKRRGELRDAGYVEDSGSRRAAPSGSSAIVWRITGRGSRRANDL